MKHLYNFLVFHVLNLLREVPNEVYSNLEAVGADDKWWEVSKFSIIHMPYEMHNQYTIFFFFFQISILSRHARILQAVELQKLILAHNNIEVLKEDLRNLSLLSVLNISHNKLSSLPAAIGEYVVFIPLFVFFFFSEYFVYSVS